MRIFRSGFEAGRWAPGAVLAIGKFDGLHLGHQRLLGAARARANRSKRKFLIATFDPSPAQFLRGELARPILPLAERLQRMRLFGADGVVLLPFDKALACMAAEAFVKDVLAGQLKIRDVFVGEDFCFGKDRAGSFSTLKAMGQELGYCAHSVKLVRRGGRKISASDIRALVEAGRVDEAERLLGSRSAWTQPFPKS